ncbi:hypothetical protein J4Q44_G00067720 [Coregonus suidteri]|uniref:Uncharacterized protein n=1 Tax=Coregonus suidteri TaxID=861788 RepID=A0AAN8QZ81_9TELE
MVSLTPTRARRCVGCNAIIAVAMEREYRHHWRWRWRGGVWVYMDTRSHDLVRNSLAEEQHYDSAMSHHEKPCTEHCTATPLHHVVMSRLLGRGLEEQTGTLVRAELEDTSRLQFNYRTDRVIAWIKGSDQKDLKITG